jgi:hypothetical protein
MRKVATIVICSLLVGVAAKAQEVTGQLIDLSCYALDKENTGNHHKNRGLICAQACAREGFAVGLLTTDGKVYQVIGELAANYNAKLAPHMSHTVTLTGEISEKNHQTVITATSLKMISK